MDELEDLDFFFENLVLYDDEEMLMKEIDKLKELETNTESSCRHTATATLTIPVDEECYEVNSIIKCHVPYIDRNMEKQ